MEPVDLWFDPLRGYAWHRANKYGIDFDLGSYMRLDLRLAAYFTWALHGTHPGWFRRELCFPFWGRSGALWHDVAARSGAAFKFARIRGHYRN